jgi:hypothetical protein
LPSPRLLSPLSSPALLVATEIVLGFRLAAVMATEYFVAARPLMLDRKTLFSLLASARRAFACLLLPTHALSRRKLHHPYAAYIISRSESSIESNRLKSI